LSVNARHDDAAPREVAEGPREERRRDGLRFVGQHLGIREPGAIVDGDVHRLPPEAAAPLAAIPVNAMAHPADLAELLDVEVEEIAGRGPLVAIRRTRGVEARQLMQAQAPLLAHHRGDGQTQLAGHARGTVALPPPLLDAPPLGSRQARRRAVRPARAIHEPGVALGLRAPKPLPDCLPGHAELPPQLRVIGVRELGAMHELHSPGIAQACILVGVHRSSGGCRLSVSTTPAWCRYDL
jgi:hypothetical protein